MDHVSAGDATRQGAGNRRRRMRDQARSQHTVQPAVPDRYQTPEWLERSFVLPLTEPEASDVPKDVPSQSVPSHDDARHLPEPRMGRHLEAVLAPHSLSGFVRPPSSDIDFARVIRRSDLCRTMTRLHWATTGLACVALVLFLLAGSPLVLGAVIVLAAVAVGAFVVRLRLTRAPVPHLQR